MGNKSLDTKVHVLKLLDDYCDDVYLETKTFELRLNDRGFKVGDTVWFVPIDNNGATIEHKISECKFVITYILNEYYDVLKNNYIIFSIKKIK